MAIILHLMGMIIKCVAGGGGLTLCHFTVSISEFDWDALDEVDGFQPPPQSDLDFETLADELMAPSWLAQPEASSSNFAFDRDAVHQAGGLPQAHESGWNLETLTQEEMGPSWSAQSGASIYDFAFDWNALHPENAVPRRTTAMPQASLAVPEKSPSSAKCRR
ncbi:hypothetical protein [Xanthomonas fragariae]|uniref:hypothetical protein n=1 Tax=Xanthomonas fragariae TaxID=48664 RepID=UPI000B448E9B|nr:hypothetical protein [Xanthomonas fragariae]